MPKSQGSTSKSKSTGITPQVMTTPLQINVIKKPTLPKIVKKKAVNSNYYLNKILEKGIDNLTVDEAREVGLLVKESHRIKPVSKAKAKQGRSVFNSVTGHHEWLPTDRALQIVTSTGVWAGFYTSLRSPTWLLVVNPERYCVDVGTYRAQIEIAAGHANSKSGLTVLASTLGLVGHSGGLCQNGVQLTKFQSTWHDELRDLYDKHAPSNAYDAYWHDLQNFINATFLFVGAATLPLAGADVKGASNDDVMKAIQWDLHLSGRGNPTGVQLATMYDVAQFLRSEWATWGVQLLNSFSAWRNS